MPKSLISEALDLPTSSLEKTSGYCDYTGETDSTYATAHVNYRSYDDKEAVMNWYENEISGKTS